MVRSKYDNLVDVIKTSFHLKFGGSGTDSQPQGAPLSPASVSVPVAQLISPTPNELVSAPTYLLRATTSDNAAVSGMEWHIRRRLPDFKLQPIVRQPVAPFLTKGDLLWLEDKKVPGGGCGVSGKICVRVGAPDISGLNVRLLGPDGTQTLLFKGGGRPFRGSDLFETFDVTDFVQSIPSLAGLWTLEVHNNTPSEEVEFYFWTVDIQRASPWETIAISESHPDALGTWSAIINPGFIPQGTYDIRACPQIKNGHGIPVVSSKVEIKLAK